MAKKSGIDSEVESLLPEKFDKFNPILEEVCSFLKVRCYLGDMYIGKNKVSTNLGFYIKKRDFMVDELEDYFIAKKMDIEATLAEIEDYCRKRDEAFSKIKKEIDASKEEAGKGASWAAKNLSPVVDAHTGEIRFIHNITGRFKPYHPKAFCTALRITMRELDEMCSDVAIIEYTPLKDSGLLGKKETAEGDIVPHFNVYSHPDWRYKGIKEAEECKTLPPIFKKFFKHLVPDEEQRRALFHWMYYATFHRSQTVLVLCGNQGVGKSIFGEDILSALVGPHNHARAGRSIMKKEFNAAWDRKRVVLIEELPKGDTPEDREEINDKFKDYCNDTISIEKKGVDAYQIENWASVVVTSNKYSNIPILVPNERRFLCLEVAVNKLETVFTQEEIRELRRICSTKEEVPDELLDLGSFIYHHGKIKKENEHYMLPTKIKYIMYESNLASWQINLIRKVQEMEAKMAGEANPFMYKKEVEQATRDRETRKTVKWSRIKQFINDHRDLEGNKLLYENGYIAPEHKGNEDYIRLYFKPQEEAPKVEDIL